jgi:glutamate synthase (NADPH) small chain
MISATAIGRKTMMTSLNSVFAGDIVRGAGLVVWAVRDGRDVTDHMHAYLKAKTASNRIAA